MEQCNHGGVKAWRPVCKSMPTLKRKIKTNKMSTIKITQKSKEFALAQWGNSPLKADVRVISAQDFTAGYIFAKEEMAVPEQADMTKELLTDIISWEKDLSEYGSLEGILREKYVITKRL